MPKTWDAPAGNSTNFLKLSPGDSALIVVLDAPMLMNKHTLEPEGDKEYGERLLCGIPEDRGCPVCENRDEYSGDAQKVASLGYYLLWVESITRAGSNAPEVIQKAMVMEGGWSVIGAFDVAKKTAETDGEEFVGAAYRITRTGERQKTRYDLAAKPKAAIVPALDHGIDIEEKALALLADDQAKQGYTHVETDASGEELDPFEEPTAQAPADEDDAALQVELYNLLAEEAGLLSEVTRKAFLKSKGIVLRGPADYAKATEALKDRIAAQKRAAA